MELMSNTKATETNDITQESIQNGKQRPTILLFEETVYVLVFNCAAVCKCVRLIHNAHEREKQSESEKARRKAKALSEWNYFNNSMFLYDVILTRNIQDGNEMSLIRKIQLALDLD